MVVKEILLPEAFYVHELEGDNGHDNPTHGRAETSRVGAAEPCPYLLLRA